MSRRPRKRTKKYQGEDAKQFNQPLSTKPIVRHYRAVDRSRIGEWWYERKRYVKPVAIAAGIGLGIVWILYELFRWIF